MADEPDEELSKRERQRQRREARKEAEQAAAKRARMARIAVFIVIGLVAAGGIGYFVQQTLAARAERAERIEEGRQLASQFGCTEVQQFEVGGGHFGPQQVAENPPQAVYDHRPTTGGTHIGRWAQTGVYDSYVDERLTTHNLEHGYVVMWYAENAPDEQVAALKEFANERIEAGDREIIVAQYNAEMDQGANFAFTAWGNRRLCDEFDERVALAFLDSFHNHSGAPEPNAGPHLAGSRGTIDPTSQQAVFPPLSGAGGEPQGDGAGEQGAEQGQDAGGDQQGSGEQTDSSDGS